MGVVFSGSNLNFLLKYPIMIYGRVGLIQLFIASPQWTVLKIQLRSCWKRLADRLRHKSVMFSFIDIEVFKLSLLLLFMTPVHAQQTFLFD